MRAAIACCFMILLVTVLCGGRATAQRTGYGFTLYARSVLEADRQPSIQVTTNVPYPSLVFLRHGEGYKAEYRVYIRILDVKGDDLIESSVVTQRVEAASYDETRSHKYSSNSTKRFIVAPGGYLVRCTIRIKDTHRAFTREAKVNVPNFLEAGIGLSKPRLLTAPIDTSRTNPIAARAGVMEELIEQESPHFSDFDRQPVFAFDVYLEDRTRDSTPCDLFYEVKAADKQQRLYGKHRVALTGEGGEFIVYAHIDDWTPGPYDLNVKAKLLDPPRETSVSLRFELEFTPLLLTERFHETLEILSLIASEQELADLRKADESKRAQLWLEFWDRRDPTPRLPPNEALQEHLRRLRYVEQNFADVGAGWQSDRGKVYIKHGQPDEVEQQSDPYLQGNYLIWRYHDSNLTFVFYDRFGLGEYRLTNSRAF